MQDKLRFTLTELLIVIAVLLVLIALLVPSLKNALSKAQIISCSSNLKSTGTGFSLFSGDNNNDLTVTWDGTNRINWMDQIHNYVVNDSAKMLSLSDMQSLYINSDKGVDLWFCPSEARSFIHDSGVASFTYVMPAFLNRWSSTGPGYKMTYIGPYVIAYVGQVLPVPVKPWNFSQLSNCDQIALLTEDSLLDSEPEILVSQGSYKVYTTSVPTSFQTWSLHRQSLNYLFVDGHVANLHVLDPTQWGSGTSIAPKGIYSVTPTD